MEHEVEVATVRILVDPQNADLFTLDADVNDIEVVHPGTGEHLDALAVLARLAGQRSNVTARLLNAILDYLAVRDHYADRISSQRL